MIQGIFYNYYWWQSRNGNEGIAFFMAILGLVTPLIPFVGIFLWLCNKYGLNLDQISDSKTLFISIFILFCTVLSIYFLYRNRYKRIINLHGRYNTQKYKYAAITYPIISIIAIIFYAILLYKSALAINN